MFKKIISLLILIGCFNISALAYYSDTYDISCREEINFLTAADVLTGYEDGSFRPQEKVTRAEFTAMIMRLCNLADIGATNMTYYPDVEQDYWALADINMATAQGMISGFSDGTFRPDQNITVNEAAKVIVCLLGYSSFAEADGGYPQGYINIAVKNGILNGITTAYDEPALRSDVAVMLYQSLDVRMAKSVDDSLVTGEGTILSDIMKLTKRTGVITATKYADMISAGHLKADEIAVDSVIYKITDEFLHELVGHRITFYIKETENDELLITYYTVDEEKSRSVLVQASDIDYDRTSRDSFVYYNESGKSETLRIEADYVTKNGESIVFDDKSVFDIKDGNVLLIDSDRSGKYETILINAALNMVAGRINTKDFIITDKFSSEKKIDLDSTDNDKTVVIRFEDSEISFNDIAEDDIMTVYESDSADRIVVYVSRNIIEGAVQSVESNGVTMDIGINNTDYTVSGNCMDALKKDTEKKNALTVGSSVKLYIDVYGNIAAIEIQGSTREKYAFLITAYVPDTDQESAVLKMWPEDSDVTEFTTAQKVSIDDGAAKSQYKPNELISKLKETAVVAVDEYYTNPMFQLIKYTLDSEGKIKTIKTALSSADGKPLRKEGIFTRDFTAQSFKTNQKTTNTIINGAYKFSDTVKIFNIPPERDDFAAFQRSVSFSKSVTANIALYDMDEHNLVEAVLIINPDYNSYYDNSMYKPFFIYDDFNIAVNDDNDIVYEACGLSKGVMRTIEIDEEPGFNRGDVFQLLEINDKVAKVNKIYDAADKAFAKGSADENGYGYTTSGDVTLAFMEVRDITSSAVVVTDGTTELMFEISNVTKVSIYDSEEDEVRIADDSEIVKGDKIVIRSYTTTAGDLVIIR